MKRELLSICGPVAINSYGVAIVIGILLGVWLLQKNPKAKQLKLNDCIIDILLVGIIAGVVGGRLLYMISEPSADMSLFNFFSLWDGGFSLLGSVLCIIPTIICFLHYIHMPILPCLDILAIYAPLLQGVSRIGCFFAGCCYGYPSDAPWSYVYTDSQSIAPLHIALHPTQLYSAISLLTIFLLLFSLLQHILQKPGQLFASYLMLISIERFFIDFWRADHLTTNALSPLLHSSLQNLSTHQMMSLLIFIGATIFFIYTSIRNHHEHI